MWLLNITSKPWVHRMTGHTEMPIPEGSPECTDHQATEMPLPCSRGITHHLVFPGASWGPWLPWKRPIHEVHGVPDLCYHI